MDATPLPSCLRTSNYTNLEISSIPPNLKDKISFNSQLVILAPVIHFQGNVQSKKRKNK